ncbi:hypothetical protein [Streptomyces sp. NBC_01445]|uniref:hypothetical protein n=1 Tax=Streptomyces sp. NBC_01445 TaxID=2903869 RepID=UPI002DD9DA82|nr:hypothetical protein [Streptomyces sp. NBC_01445]WSE09940.1 hypothetical protein OG574_45335 [Streptomyces sp. NBC_01445]
MRIAFAEPARGLAHRSVQANPAAGDHQREPVATGGERSSARRPVPLLVPVVTTMRQAPA